uniref:MAM domain-containing protein n=1 Tax=Clytia hemisphaerica TaxID=252671 RepID=A0A7M5UET4_9CNID
VNGGWSRWSSWSACDVYCGNGRQSRQRLCNEPAPRKNGNPCNGKSRETKSCRSGACYKSRYDCEFDNDGWCLWRSQHGHWKIVSSNYNDEIVGPKTDVSFGIGRYLILKDDQKDSLILKDLPKNQICFSFHLQKTKNTKLIVTGLDASGKHILFQSHPGGKPISEWTNVKIPLIDARFIEIQIDGHTEEAKDFIAIDDIFFTKEKCSQNVLREEDRKMLKLKDL